MRVTTRRARIVKVNDQGSQQLVDLKVLKNEKPQKVWRPQDFGFSSNPPQDCDGVVTQMGSRSDRTLYQDGGHEKYRPKKTPVGGAVLFNHTGDIIRVFKDNTDVVHQKVINIRIGHGYAAGQSGDGSSGVGADSGGGDDQPDDTSDQDTKTISVVLNGDAITVAYQDAKVTWTESSLTAEYGDGVSTTWEDGKITHEAPIVVVKSPDVRLGGEEASVFVGLCGGGCSTTTKAI